MRRNCLEPLDPMVRHSKLDSSDILTIIKIRNDCLSTNGKRVSVHDRTGAMISCTRRRQRSDESA